MPGRDWGRIVLMELAANLVEERGLEERGLVIMADLPPLTVATVQGILTGEISDQTVNELLWHCLGYRYDPATGQWDHSRVEPAWREEYPQPPDFIGSRPATVKLTRSIPPQNKQLLKEQLHFEGYQVRELNPRLTRRATAANWLLSYFRQIEE